MVQAHHDDWREQDEISIDGIEALEEHFRGPAELVEVIAWGRRACACLGSDLCKATYNGAHHSRKHDNAMADDHVEAYLGIAICPIAAVSVLGDPIKAYLNSIFRVCVP